MTGPENQALYLFYLTRAECVADQPASPLEDGSSLVAHRAGDLVALTSQVCVDEFCGPQAERNLGDVRWIGERAFRHEQVVEQGARCGPVLPARLGTLFSSAAALDRFIAANRGAIARFLSHVEGQQEWGIKVLLARLTARRWLADEMASASAQPAASAGLRYLQQRRFEAQAEKALQRWLSETCESVACGLRDGFVTGLRARKVAAGMAEEAQGEVVLNLAVLVPFERRDDLAAHIEELNRERDGQGLRFKLNGPWPPYSFCPSLATVP